MASSNDQSNRSTAENETQKPLQKKRFTRDQEQNGERQLTTAARMDSVRECVRCCLLYCRLLLTSSTELVLVLGVTLGVTEVVLPFARMLALCWISVRLASSVGLARYSSYCS